MSIRQELIDWIDNDAIAESIIEGLKEYGLSITLENAKELWLNVLENELWDAVCASANAISERRA